MSQKVDNLPTVLSMIAWQWLVYVFQTTCAKDPTTSHGLYDIGCFKLMTEEIIKHETIILSVAIPVVAVMVSIAGLIQKQKKSDCI